jgi:hypothetical protein
MTAEPAPPGQLAEAFAAVLDAGSPLSALQAAREVRELMPAWESHLARQALAAGATWEAIGAALGISRQAAWERLRPGIAGQIQAERSRIESEQHRLNEERTKRWPTKRK